MPPQPPKKKIPGPPGNRDGAGKGGAGQPYSPNDRKRATFLRRPTPPLQTNLPQAEGAGRALLPPPPSPHPLRPPTLPPCPPTRARLQSSFLRRQSLPLRRQANLHTLASIAAVVQAPAALAAGRLRVQGLPCQGVGAGPALPCLPLSTCPSRLNPKLRRVCPGRTGRKIRAAQYKANQIAACPGVSGPPRSRPSLTPLRLPRIVTPTSRTGGGV